MELRTSWQRQYINLLGHVVGRLAIHPLSTAGSGLSRAAASGPAECLSWDLPSCRSPCGDTLAPCGVSEMWRCMDGKLQKNEASSGFLRLLWKSGDSLGNRCLITHHSPTLWGILLIKSQMRRWVRSPYSSKHFCINPDRSEIRELAGGNECSNCIDARCQLQREIPVCIHQFRTD